MFSSSAVNNLPHDAVSASEFSSYVTHSHSAVKQFTHLKNLLVRIFSVKRRVVHSKNFDAMLNILNSCRPFEIFDRVIGFYPAFVIALQVGFWTDKRIENDPRQSRSLCDSIFAETNVGISIGKADAKYFAKRRSSFQAAHNALIGSFVQPLVAINGMPFHQGIIHIGTVI